MLKHLRAFIPSLTEAVFPPAKDKKVRQKGFFPNLRDELEEAVKVLHLQGLTRAEEILKEHLKKIIR